MLLRLALIFSLATSVTLGATEINRQALLVSVDGRLGKPKTVLGGLPVD